MSNTCPHATGFDAQSIFHCCFAYRVEPRCPIDQIQINKEAVSYIIEFHISLVLDPNGTLIKVLNDAFLRYVNAFEANRRNR